MMSEYMDPDVQDELQAMSGATKVPLFGASRPSSKCDKFNFGDFRILIVFNQ